MTFNHRRWQATARYCARRVQLTVMLLLCLGAGVFLWSGSVSAVKYLGGEMLGNAYVVTFVMLVTIVAAMKASDLMAVEEREKERHVVRQQFLRHPVKTLLAPPSIPRWRAALAALKWFFLPRTKNNPFSNDYEPKEKTCKPSDTTTPSPQQQPSSTASTSAPMSGVKRTG